MVMILRALVPQRDYRDYLAQGVEAHFGVRPDFEAPDD
jgi:hypothetical protein